MRLSSLFVVWMFFGGLLAVGQQAEEAEKKPSNPFYAELKVIVNVQAKLDKAQGGSKTRYEKLLVDAQARLTRAVNAKKSPLLKRMGTCKRDLAKAGSKSRKKVARERMKQIKEQLEQIDAWAAEDILARDAPAKK